MGLFDFVKDAGAKVGIGKSRAEEEAEAAEKEREERAAERATKARAERAERRREGAKSRELEKYVTDLGLAVSDLDIRFDDGRATITGEAENHTDREKVVLAVGNVSGVGQVDDQMTVKANLMTDKLAAAAKKAMDNIEERAAQSTMHTVVSGDTLWALAERYYGNGSEYNEIFEANRPMLSDPDKIFVGQVLRIPPRD